MVSGSKTLLAAAFSAGFAASTVYCPRAAYGSDFSAFAEDEAACSRVGGAAIKGGSGGLAAQRYDYAYRRCMAAHVRMRQMDAYGQSGPYNNDYPVGNPHSFDYPDAFYSVPYATPGYGYDGFGY